ncbi:WXG100 family type VII secretion target [Spongisporangium articulatum]|uniref:WXG100 family type VII secretion target n=1 Tax=Spongisporangium articulatum TaxID=3362603 RepID=A0ABW8AU32_9ACTN
MARALAGPDEAGVTHMAGEYSLQQEAMAKGAQAVDDASVQIDGHLKKLDAEVQTMFGGWSSDAQRSFATLHANWVAQQNKLTTALRDMHTALVSTANTYAQQEEQQSSAFNHIAGQL